MFIIKYKITKIIIIVFLIMFESLESDSQQIKYSFDINSNITFLNQTTNSSSDNTPQFSPSAGYSYSEYSFGKYKSTAKPGISINNKFSSQLNKYFSIKIGFGFQFLTLNKHFVFDNDTYDLGSGFSTPQIYAIAGKDYCSVYGYAWYRDSEGNLIINDDPADEYSDGFLLSADKAMILSGTFNTDYTENIFILDIPLQIQFNLFKDKLIVSSGISISVLLKEKNKDLVISSYIDKKIFNPNFLNMLFNLEYKTYRKVYTQLSFSKSFTNIENTSNSNDNISINNFSLGLSYKF